MALTGAPVKLTTGVAKVAVVVWAAVAALKGLAATQLAVRLQVPVPLVMVTVAVAVAGVPLSTLTVQTPAAVMVGITLAFVVAVTTKLLLYAAVAGAPVKVTTGVRNCVVAEAMLDHAEERATVWNGTGFGETGVKLSLACTL